MKSCHHFGYYIFLFSKQNHTNNIISTNNTKEDGLSILIKEIFLWVAFWKKKYLRILYLSSNYWHRQRCEVIP